MLSIVGWVGDNQPNKNRVCKKCGVGAVRHCIGLPKSGNPTYAAMQIGEGIVELYIVIYPSVIVLAVLSFRLMLCFPAIYSTYLPRVPVETVLI